MNDYAIMDFGYAAVLLLFGVLLVWTARYVWQTRTVNSKEKEFRELAEESVARQTATGAQVTSLTSEVADLQRRVQAMEKLLRDAE
ncbi:hypothetical protein M1L60_25260 [Actinoplanes sp. TRM 88003]|uniref:Uncharacterized protein n=1 Tax=Paractinoplanes aksuensis TaxID=2939490 RepID=A0ABT1DW87_9ACTN|nr:hypothetical protein [Actinoplanes aksuensis]MCO8273911.1 hypothetical protein [Actinoplanes aksuensis]